MAGEGKKSNDFYSVMGLMKECSEAELRNAYKKLALRWHPDRCSASGNLKYVEEAKKKFQAIQEAYSVLSDTNKRFLYDVGVYNCDDDDDENGMGDFLNEMAVMMSQNKSNENGEEDSFEELKELFEEMFQSEIGSFDSPSSKNNGGYSSTSYSVAASSSSLFPNYGERERESSNKRDSSGMMRNIDKSKDSSSSSSGFDTNFHGFCFGTGGTAGKYEGRRSSGRRNNGRK